MAEKKRITCRDEDGKARLMPGMSIMTAVEALCRLEERYLGVMVIPARPVPEMLRCRDCRRYRQEAFNSGYCERKGVVVGGSRKACEAFAPVGAGEEGDRIAAPVRRPARNDSKGDEGDGSFDSGSDVVFPDDEGPAINTTRTFLLFTI